MSQLTIFTAPKPFTNPHINLIQRNAIQSWMHLGPEVDVILIGQEQGLSEIAQEFGLLHLPDVARNSFGTPLVSSIFELARQASQSPLLAYINADILVMPDFVESAQLVSRQLQRFLMVGQRWDLDVQSPVDFSGDWVSRLQQQVEERGRLHPRGGSDYFIFPRDCFTSMPQFAIGRAGWDNWMFYEARRSAWPLIDSTPSIRIVHQDHDYSHLPKGQPHYRLPETAENIRLAGGKRTIFNLIDADRQLQNGKIFSVDSGWKKFWREVEIFPLVRLHSFALGNLFFALFHPVKAFHELRAWASRKIRRQS